MVKKHITKTGKKMNVRLSEVKINTVLVQTKIMSY